MRQTHRAGCCVFPLDDSRASRNKPIGRPTRITMPLGVRFVLLLRKVANNDDFLDVVDLRRKTSGGGVGIGGGGVGDGGAVRLARALRRNDVVREVYLDNNGIRGEGAEALGRALVAESSALQRLHLGGNRIGNVGARALADKLGDNLRLSVLDLSDNEIGDGGVERLALALRTNSALSELDLRNNKISDPGARALIQMLHNLSSLSQNSTLTKIDLDGNNKIGAKLLQKIQRLLEINEESSGPEDACLRKDAEFGECGLTPQQQRQKMQAAKTADGSVVMKGEERAPSRLGAIREDSEATVETDNVSMPYR